LSLALLLAALPVLYWEQPPETADSLRKAGIERLRVPPERAAAWKAAGLDAVPLDPAEKSERAVVPGPGIAGRADAASATRRPWIDANGWRYLRSAKGRFFETAPKGTAALAAAEAYAYGADLVLAIDPADVAALGEALSFLRSVKAMELPDVADVGVVGDGSPLRAGDESARAPQPAVPASGPRLQQPFASSRARPAAGPREAASPDACALLGARSCRRAAHAAALWQRVVLAPSLQRGPRRRRLVSYSGRNIRGCACGCGTVGARRRPGAATGPRRRQVSSLAGRRNRVLAGRARPLRGRRPHRGSLTPKRSSR
jgi:hypothetical protein